MIILDQPEQVLLDGSGIVALSAEHGPLECEGIAVPAQGLALLQILLGLLVLSAPPSNPCREELRFDVIRAEPQSVVDIILRFFEPAGRRCLIRLVSKIRCVQSTAGVITHNAQHRKARREQTQIANPRSHDAVNLLRNEFEFGRDTSAERGVVARNDKQGDCASYREGACGAPCAMR
jgi:hypothetical protein